MTSTGNKGHHSLLLAGLWCQVMSLPKECHRSSVIKIYQLLEQHFPVAVSFHNLQEVTAQGGIIPARETAASCFYISVSVRIKQTRYLLVN